MATIAEKWVQQGLQQGLEQGLQQGLGQGERQVLLRQVRHRFGEATARQSETLLARITDPIRLEDLGEALLECEDGAAWLYRLRAAG